MPFVPVPGCAEFELVYLYDGQICENTLWFKYDGAPDSTQLLATAAAIHTWFTGAFGPNLSSNVQLNVIRATSHDTIDGAAVDYTTGLPEVATGPDGGAPGNVAPCISFKTGVRGRSFRGRNYIVGIPEAELVRATIDSGWLGAVTNAYNALSDSTDPTGATWVVVSRFSGVDPDTKKPIPRAEGLSTPIISAAFTDNTSDSQRRRLPGRGT
jgi:hypothetical protein